MSHDPDHHDIACVTTAGSELKLMNFIPEEWHSNVPLMCAIIERLSDVNSLDDAISQDIPAALTAISRSDEHGFIVRSTAEKWLNDCNWVHILNSVPGNILLGQSSSGNLLAIGVSVGFDPTKFRSSTAIDSILIPLSAGGLTINVSPHCGNMNLEVPDRDLRVLARNQLHYDQHSALFIRRGTVFDYADRQSLVLKFELSGHRSGLNFHFEPKEGRYAGASLSSTTDSQLLAFISAMRATATPEMAKLLATYTKHPSHWIRWEAVKTVAELDEVLAVELIKTLVEDPHPEIRAAARKTLEESI